MAINTLKCNHLMPLPFKGLKSLYRRLNSSSRTWRSAVVHFHYLFSSHHRYHRHRRCAQAVASSPNELPAVAPTTGGGGGGALISSGTRSAGRAAKHGRLTSRRPDRDFIYIGDRKNHSQTSGVRISPFTDYDPQCLQSSCR